MKAATIGLKSPEERSRSREEAVSYAVAHATRIDILCILNEGSYSGDELAKRMGQTIPRVQHHIDALVEAGSIEVASIRKTRNVDQKFYRAVEIPFFTDEEMAEKTPEERREIYGLILQASLAEAMASFRAGKIHNDPRVVMAWRWFNVDAKGREEIADALTELWELLWKIQARSLSRCSETGEQSESIIVTTLGHERCRRMNRA